MKSILFNSGFACGFDSGFRELGSFVGEPSVSGWPFAGKRMAGKLTAGRAGGRHGGCLQWESQSQ